MALIRLGALSDALGMAFHVQVALPEFAGRPPFPVLWLLHGAGDDASGWFRNTNVERLATRRGLAVVAPDAQLSMYEDMAHGQRFFTHIADELPEMLARLLPLSRAQEDNFVAGLSMGGTGALKLAMRRPGQYAAVGCLSAGYSNYRFHEPHPDTPREKRYAFVYGGGTEGIDAADARWMEDARAVAASGTAPRVYQACGLDDSLLRNARIARDFFRSFPGDPFRLVYREYPGRHNWDFWGARVPELLDFLLDR